jgi:hypothetical protein
MMRMITVQKILEQRDVDAALYLLGRMLGMDSSMLGERRKVLEDMQRRLTASRKITAADRTNIVSHYHEVVG